MAWTSWADFTTIHGAGAEPSIAVSYAGRMLVAVNLGGTAGTWTLYEWDTVSWTDVLSGGTQAGYVYAMREFNGDIYIATWAGSPCGSGGGIYYYNSVDGLVNEVTDTGDCWQFTNFVEYSSELYLCSVKQTGTPTFMYGVALARNGGAWDITIDGFFDTPNKWTIGLYDSDLYLSNANGTNIGTNTNHIREYSGGNFSTSWESEGNGSSGTFFDEFIDTDTTLLTAHTANLGGSWNSVTGSAEIEFDTYQNSKAVLDGTAECIITCDETDPDGQVVIQIGPDTSNSNWQGIAFRVQDANNYWFAGYIHDGTPNLAIIKVDAGTPTTEASTNETLSGGDIYYLKLILDGDDITLYLNDTTSITHNSSFLNSEGSHGLFIGDSNGVEVHTFRFIPDGSTDLHVPVRSFLPDGTDLYTFEGQYVHYWDNLSWSLDYTFPLDVYTEFGLRDAIKFDGSYFTGYGKNIYVNSGSGWGLDPDSEIGYQTTNNKALEDTPLAVQPYSWNPPIGFCEYDSELYVCAAGEVWVRSDVGPYDVKAIAISKSKAADDRLYLTFIRGGSELVLRTYDVSNPAAPSGELETSLGPSTVSEVDAKTTIAYPHAPNNGTVSYCYIHGRVYLAGDYRHVIGSDDAGSTLYVIEDGWGTDVCGALVTTTSGLIYAIRNTPTISYLYRGTTSLSYVSTLPFPVNYHALALSNNEQILYAGNNIGSDTPRIIGSAYPFNTWVNITFNYPISGEVTAIVPL